MAFFGQHNREDHRKGRQTQYGKVRIGNLEVVHYPNPITLTIIHLRSISAHGRFSPTASISFLLLFFFLCNLNLLPHFAWLFLAARFVRVHG